MTPIKPENCKGSLTEDSKVRGGHMKITRKWAMPNKQTFHIPPIKEFVEQRVLPTIEDPEAHFVDPFVGKSPFKSICYSNDLDPDIDAHTHVDALEFLQVFADSSVDGVFFDPPYSPRQVAESYKKMGRSVNMQTAQGSYWSKMKKEIGRIVTPGGFCITCGWNSGGIGKKYGFEIKEILLVAHGGWHNDTIVTLEYRN